MHWPQHGDNPARSRAIEQDILRLGVDIDRLWRARRQTPDGFVGAGLPTQGFVVGTTSSSSTPPSSVDACAEIASVVFRCPSDFEMERTDRMLSWTFEAGTATNDGSTGQDLSCGSSYDSLCAGGAPSGNTAKVSFNFDPNNGLVGSNDGQYFHRFVTVWINLDGYVSVEVHYRSNPSPTQSGYVHYCNSSASITDGTEIEVPYSSHEVIAGPYTVINAKPSSVYVTVNL